MNAQPAPPTTVGSRKEYMTATMLSFFLGVLGIDRFYLGYTGLGILKLLTIGGFGIWYTIDVIRIATHDLRDHDGQELAYYDRDRKTAWLIMGIFWAINMIFSLLSLSGYLLLIIIAVASTS